MPHGHMNSLYIYTCFLPSTGTASSPRPGISTYVKKPYAAAKKATDKTKARVLKDVERLAKEQLKLKTVLELGEDGVRSRQ